MKKTKFIYSLLFLILIFSFKNKQENNIVGIWKIDIYKINNDTIYNQKSEVFTFNYFKKSNINLDSTIEIKVENEAKFKEFFNAFKNIRIEFTPKFLNSYIVDDKGQRMKTNAKISYKIIKNKIIINKQDKEKFNFEIDYDINKDILIINQLDGKIKVIITYSRINK